jgi:hypothetical protein
MELGAGGGEEQAQEKAFQPEEWYTSMHSVLVL